MELKVRRVDWEFRTPFRIAYRTRTHAQTVQVELRDGAYVGRGEALGVSYHGESVETLLAQVADVARDVENGLTRDALQMLLPAGGARNAIDCALWDLEAKRAHRRVWELASIAAVHPLLTAYTLGVDMPDAMARAADAARQYSLLKLKLTGTDDIERVVSIRRARADADLIVNANQAWTMQQLRDFAPRLAELGIKLIEQPLKAGDDGALAGFASPIPLCADESCQTTESLSGLMGKYQYINLKLDKTGGLTEALRLARAAQERGLKLMVGCMGGSSLSMAPAFTVGQLSDVVDLDGPLVATSDVPHAIRYDGSHMSAPTEALWG